MKCGRSVHVYIQRFCISKKALMLLLASFEDFLVQEPVPSIEICMYMKVRIRDTKSKTQSGKQKDGIAKG